MTARLREADGMGGGDGEVRAEAGHWTEACGAGRVRMVFGLSICFSFFWWRELVTPWARGLVMRDVQ
jgi:hypothetical protein